MRLAGVCDKGKGRSPVTTGKAKTSGTRADLVQRDVTADDPNRLWVADITYVKTRAGFVYAAFVTDVFSRRIAGWALSNSMRAEALPLQALIRRLRMRNLPWTWSITVTMALSTCPWRITSSSQLPELLNLQAMMGIV
ncbi:DDE-type integrase/transposase/recombinase, partial [Arcanobacterium canis]